MTRPHVVIIGGGFGGLATARTLRDAPVRVTLIDKRNHHLFQPLLYQVATAALSPSDIAEPLRGILHGQANAEVRLGEVTAVDPEARTVTVGDATLSYDHLVVAAGARTSYFGNDHWKTDAPGLKTIGDALEIRHRMLHAFERAEWTDDADLRRRLCTFVIVGAGPTGVEMAGAIREIATHSLASDFRNVDLNLVRVLLVEGLDEVLPTFPDDLRKAARRQLEELGVEVWTGKLVEDIDGSRLVIGGETVEAETVVWAAGVQPSSLAGDLDAPVDRGGRVCVDPDLSVPGHPEIRVIGDMAAVAQSDGSTVPGVAQAAMQMGTHAARTILDDLVGQQRRPFRYVDKGSLATIGRSKAVADLGRIHTAGFGAWVLWVFVHLMFLVGHRNRVVVLLKWSWAWLTWDRSSRLLWRDEALRDEGAFSESLREAAEAGDTHV